jgi:hypothetical protein
MIFRPVVTQPETEVCSTRIALRPGITNAGGFAPGDFGFSTAKLLILGGLEYGWLNALSLAGIGLI